MQDPTVIEGVSNSEFLRTAKGEITGEKVNLYSFIKDMEGAMKSGEMPSGHPGGMGGAPSGMKR